MQNQVYRPTAPTLTGLGLTSGPKKKFLIIGRDLCSFSWIDQKAQTDKSARRREAELEALRIAVTQDAGYYVVLWRNSASVWTWDRAAVEAALSRASRDDLAQAVQVPEPLILAPEIISDGAQLAQCMNGCEGQLWRDGELVGSRWWRETPSDQDWLRFEESIGAPGSAHAPLTKVREPLPRPWKLNEYRPPTSQLVDRRAVFWAGAAISALSLAGLTYAGGVELSYRRLASDVASLDEATQSIRATHRRVMQAAADYRRITAPIAGVDGLALTTAVASVAARSNLRATGVELNGTRVTMSFTQSDAAAIDMLLGQVDENEYFERARLSGATGRPDEIVVEADLVVPQ